MAVPGSTTGRERTWHLTTAQRPGSNQTPCSSDSKRAAGSSRSPFRTSFVGLLYQRSGAGVSFQSRVLRYCPATPTTNSTTYEINQKVEFCMARRTVAAPTTA